MNGLLKSLIVILRVHVCVSVISAKTYFTISPVSNAVDQDTVIHSFYNSASELQCALDCATLGAVAFYYDRDDVICHCSGEDVLDLQIVDSSSLIYGNVSAIATTTASTTTPTTTTPTTTTTTTTTATTTTTTTTSATTTTDNSAACQTLYDRGHRTAGTYTVNPGDDPVECDFSSLQWIVFQRRMDGSVDFNRNWAGYVNGFGNAAFGAPSGEFWLGLERLHLATKDGCELHVYVEAPDASIQANGYARYSYFSVGALIANYSLSINGFSGNVIDKFSDHSGAEFTTKDADNDGHESINCADKYVGGWWFIRCLGVHLNGQYLTPGVTVDKKRGLVWTQPWGSYYSLQKSEMAYRCQ